MLYISAELFMGNPSVNSVCLSGAQVGSYFGSELCPVDLDQDGVTDLLLVGAPLYHIHGEEGRVYVYHLEKEVKTLVAALTLIYAALAGWGLPNRNPSGTLCWWFPSSLYINLFGIS